MPDKRVPLVNGEFYHIFNRGVAKQPTFIDKRDYEQTTLGASYYRFIKPPMRLSRFKGLSYSLREDILEQLETAELHVKIICYCLMPNHFHFLLQQTNENGISIFLSKFTNSYTKYFNTKRNRVGPVFQGVFKAVLLEGEEQLINLSRYIHINPVTSFVIKDKELFSYPWSSLSYYLQQEPSFVSSGPILSHFSSLKDYQNFLIDQLDYAKTLEQVKHLLHE